MTTTTRTATTLTLTVLVAVGALAGCSSQGTPDAAPVTTAAPVVIETTAPVEPTTPETPEAEVPVADEWSQVVNGTLYQGTEKAPVRIGTDVPGAPPAAESSFTRAEGWEGFAASQDKYVVSVFPKPEGWTWKLFGLDRFGSFRELANSGYQQGVYLPSREAAVAGPFVVDGRTLDRAEIILTVAD